MARLVKHIVPAPAARQFYFDLRTQGAVRRPSPLWTWYYAAVTPTALALVAVGAFVFEADLAQANSWGIAAALVGWPLLLWLNPLWYATLAFVRWADAEGWHAAQRHPSDRRPARPQRPTLPVRYRSKSLPLVRIGSRCLHLGKLSVTREASALVAWRDGQAVAILDLAGEAATERTWAGRAKAS